MEYTAENVLNVLAEITPESLRAFRQWYPEANATARRIDPANPVRSAAILALWSNSTFWPITIRLAEEAYAAWRQGIDPEAYVLSARGYKWVARLVAGILWGGNDPASAFGKRAIKTRAFWQAIVDPTNPDYIVIDRHAHDIAAGGYLTEAERPTVTLTVFMACRDAYVEAAAVYGARTGDDITPVEVQAATWAHWRATHAKEAKAANRKAGAKK